ncbi:MAG: oligopeptidase A [Verrucomicrobiales bacterium]|jgi:oligopeptidase A
MNPFLEKDFLIRWSTLTPDYIEADISVAMKDAGERLDAVASVDRGRLTYENTLLAFDNATVSLSEAWGKVGHLDSVCNSDALREVYNKMLPSVTEFYAKIHLNDSLWDVFKTFEKTPEAQALTGIHKRHLEDTMADFRESGADLPKEKKQRLEQLETELAQITQKFSENVLDSTNAYDLVIDDESRLAGLPATALATALQDAKRKEIATDENPKWRFTLQMPSYFPVMQYLDDEGIRQQLWQARSTIASEGDHDNTELIWQILARRQEKAQLLGKANFADTVLERRMAKNGATALKFVEDMHSRVKDGFGRQVRELQEFKAEAQQNVVDLLEPWETSYWSEKRRRQLFDFDAEELRPYFPIDAVLSGMFHIAEELFGIKIQERKSVFIDSESGESAPEEAVEVWHEEVKFYEIRNDRGTHLGSFYADWHPRESKRAGAWMNYLKTGRPPTDEGDREPHLGLICGNMTPGVDGNPALLTHSEVETVFHEFGHLLHHLLGNVEVKSLNGVNVAWDFVELPSQIMENFCWHRESLDRFARHFETGEPIPQKLFKRMLAAKNYMSAAFAMRQLSLGKLDLELHIHHPHREGKSMDELTNEILADYLMPTKSPVPTMARSFGHLFASSTGYAAGYYSYLWAEVLDADAFTRFRDAGVVSAKVGGEFRDKILSRGNSEDPAVLFRDFMGRDPDIGALLERNGLS